MTGSMRLAVVTAVAFLVLGGSRPPLDASNAPPTPSTGPSAPGPKVKAANGTIAIRTLGKHSNGTTLNAMLWNLTVVGATQYGPFNVQLNTTKTLQVPPGNYTAQGATGELSTAPCPPKSLTVQSGKTTVMGYLVTRQGPGQATCVLYP